MGKDTVDSLLAALASRIRGFTQSGDPSELLDRGALHEARKLWEAAQGTYPGSLGVPPDVLEVIAHLHLARYQVLPEGQGDPDGQTAISLFIMLMDQFPERLPEDVRKFFAAAPTQSAAIDDTDRLIAAGNSALNQYRYDGRSEMLDAALKAYHEAVSVVPLDHPSYAGCLSNLASALCLRFERDGNGADLDEAIDLAGALSPPLHLVIPAGPVFLPISAVPSSAGLSGLGMSLTWMPGSMQGSRQSPRRRQGPANSPGFSRTWRSR